MTTPDDARDRAKEALERATEIRDRGFTIAERWRKSQQANNFRQMLRNLGQGITHNGPS